MIIVTGANGFIGSAIVWELNSKNFTKIVCVDSVDLQTRNVLEDRKYEHFLHKDEIWNFLSENTSNIEAVIHMGACSSTTEMDLDFLMENNTEYTNRLFSWCAKESVPYIYASSAATYGDGQLGFDDNIDPEVLRPLNPYGESKVKSDRWILKQAQENPEKTPPHWYGLRFFNVFGPNEYHKENMSSVVFKAFHQIQETSELKLFRSHHCDYKDGEQMRDFVYIKDISRWVVELLEGKAQSGIYNLGFGKARTWIDLARTTFSSLNKETQVQWIDIPENIRDKYQYYTEANIEKLKKQGLSSPQWPLEKAVEDYVKNYLLPGRSL